MMSNVKMAFRVYVTKVLNCETVLQCSDEQMCRLTQATVRSYCVQVCREYQRGVCTRTQSECRYAHPPNGMAVDADNHVTVCMDFIKGRCHRETCRYFHPPPHLQAQIKTSQQRAIVSCLPF